MTHPEFATLSASAYDQLDPIGGAQAVTSRAAEVCNGVEVTEHHMAGSAADALCDVATNVDADLIVVGSRGMTGARPGAWLGAEFRRPQRPMLSAHRPDDLIFWES